MAEVKCREALLVLEEANLLTRIRDELEEQHDCTSGAWNVFVIANVFGKDKDAYKKVEAVYADIEKYVEKCLKDAGKVIKLVPVPVVNVPTSTNTQCCPKVKTIGGG